MSLLPTPVINDGTADRTFVFKSQDLSPKAKSTGGTWIEPAAARAVDSKLVVKYDESKKTLTRRLMSYGIKAAISDGTYRPIVVNVTCSHHPEHTEGDISKAVLVAVNSTKLAGFITRWVQGLIG